MTDESIEVQISSDLDYDNLIAEIHIGSKFVGLVTNEPGKGVCFEMPDGNGGFNPINFEIFKVALDKAKKELMQD